MNDKYKGLGDEIVLSEQKSIEALPYSKAKKPSTKDKTIEKAIKKVKPD